MAEIERVLRVSTRHMPDCSQDLSVWHWGGTDALGLTWVFAYEEDCFSPEDAIPEWLLNICITARQAYACNWILLDPVADPLDDFPTYEHP
jgi:hypothetical protein